VRVFRLEEKLRWKIVAFDGFCGIGKEGVYLGGSLNFAILILIPAACSFSFVTHCVHSC
jgi:hypothetical protein